MCILESPETFDNGGRATKATWLRRCDRGELFYSKDSWSYLPGAIKLPVPEGSLHNFTFPRDVFKNTKFCIYCYTAWKFVTIVFCGN